MVELSEMAPFFQLGNTKHNRGYVGRKQRLTAADIINFNMLETSGRSSTLVLSTRV